MPVPQAGLTAEPLALIVTAGEVRLLALPLLPLPVPVLSSAAVMRRKADAVLEATPLVVLAGALTVADNDGEEEDDDGEAVGKAAAGIEATGRLPAPPPMLAPPVGGAATAPLAEQAAGGIPTVKGAVEGPYADCPSPVRTSCCSSLLGSAQKSGGSQGAKNGPGRGEESLCSVRGSKRSMYCLSTPRCLCWQ